MKPLIVLLTVFCLSLLATKIFNKRVNFLLSGKIALAVMLVFTSIAHFMFTQPMAMMLPDFIPSKTAIIYFTGFLEIAAAIGIFIPKIRHWVGVLLIAFFILILPANIYAAINNINYETGNTDGPGISYLWFRIPFQILLIAWTYFFVLKKSKFSKV
ncbi:MAG: hypothetical protein Q4F57_01195 [Weeksellaceae bacterium]|nr:hypothetical protein [Weeksellaceae bacterium]